MNSRFLLSKVLLILVVLSLITMPVAAQTIKAGIDVWTTSNDGNTWVDFTDNPLPAGFFCAGSTPFAQVVKVRGLPIATNPAGVLNQTDTIIQRLGDADLSSGSAEVKIQARAICFQERSLVSVVCGDGTTKTFKTRVRINPAVNVTTLMTIKAAGGGAPGGTYDAKLTIPGLVKFVDTATNQATAEVAEVVNLQTTGAAWADHPGNGGVTWTSGVTIGAGCETVGTLPVALPGVSSNFAAGWSNSCNPPCPIVVQHNGPHPVTPVPPPPPCPRATVLAEKLSSRTYAGTEVLTVSADIQAVPCQVQSAGEVVQVIGADAIVK